MDVRGPVESNSVWFRDGTLAIRISEVAAVSQPNNQAGSEFPFKIRLKSGEEINIREKAGLALLAALY
jgi:hypothetical protein